MTPRLFLSNDKKIAQTLKQMNKYNFFLKEKDFSSKNASGRADCSCDNPWKIVPTKRFLDQSPKKVWKII